jgi:signal transduction histidine kinase
VNASPRRQWAVFAVSAALVLAALCWMTVQALALERGEASSRAQAARAAVVRLALWRLDSACSSELLRAASSALAPGAGHGSSNLFVGAFDVGLTGPARMVAAGAAGAAERIAALPDDDLRRAFPAAEQNAAATPLPGHDVEFALRNAQAQSVQNVVPNAMAESQQQGAGSGVAGEPGPLLPVWCSAGRGRELVFLRRSVRRGPALQGLLVDWAQLQRFLADAIADLLPGARLIPNTALPLPGEARMASLPVELVLPEPSVETASSWSPIRVGLLIAWTTAIAALVAVGFMLRSAHVLSARRARFVAAVTHELRTPLTTFQLYAQMLCSGMVPEAGRAEYLGTLVTESERLVRVVDGVLQYSRLEGEQRAPVREPIGLAGLLARIVPPLAARAAAADLRLEVEGDAGDARLSTHVQSVEQILANLVDNACKYAKPATDRRLHLRVCVSTDHSELTLQDHGPGIAAADRERVFRPFHRGSDDRVVAMAGVGLGLAIAREMAERLGGSLTLAPPPPNNAGATFTLRLPRTAK